MELSTDEQSLLLAGGGYLLIVIVWIWTLSVRSKVLLRDIAARIDPSLWQELGAPTSMKQAMKDPERRWMKFIRSGEFRRRCSTEVIDLIDDYRQRSNRMLIILGIGGALLLYRYRAILLPQLIPWLEA
jgi:hypothetical protein